MTRTEEVVTVGRLDQTLATKPLLSVEDTAAMLGQSRSSLYRAIERGDLPLPVVTINGRLRIPRRAVERLVDGDIDSSIQRLPADGDRTATRDQNADVKVPGTPQNHWHC